MKESTKNLLKTAIPIAIIVFLLIFRFFLGLILLLAYILYRVITGRAGMMAMMGKTSYYKGDIDKAIRWFGRAYRTGKAHPQVVTSYAYLQLKQGRVEEAEQVLKGQMNKKLSQDDLNYAKSNYALVLWKKGDLDGAISMLEEIIRDYKTTTLYGSLGYLYIVRGDLEKALEFNREAYEYNNTNAVIQDNLGQTCYMAGEYDKALEIYEKLIPTNPGFPEAYYNYALVLLKRDMPARALANLEKSLKYKLTFLSAITREDIDARIEEAKAAAAKTAE